MDETRWTLVAQLPLSADTEKLGAQLLSQNIVHRIVVDEHRQSIWVENPEDIAAVNKLLGGVKTPRPVNPWFDQQMPRNRRGPSGRGRSAAKLNVLFKQFPIVMISILLSALGALLVTLDLRLGEGYPWISKLAMGVGGNGVFVPFTSQLASGEIWRVITPIFLHFGLIHLAFNTMCLWLFGTRIEMLMGSRKLLVILLLTGIAGNLAQYFFYPPALFGGMSGAVFGLFGFLFVRHKFAPNYYSELPPVLVLMMGISLALGLLGALNFVASGGVANGAHLGGLVTGMAMGWFSAQAELRRR